MPPGDLRNLLSSGGSQRHQLNNRSPPTGYVARNGLATPPLDDTRTAPVGIGVGESGVDSPASGRPGTTADGNNYDSEMDEDEELGLDWKACQALQ